MSRARNATGNAGAQARGAAKRVSDGSRKIVRRTRRTREEP